MPAEAGLNPEQEKGGKHMVTIDTEKCIGCGLCAKDCPADRLKIVEGKAVYTSKCIQCGHCVAICPQGAVSIPEYDMNEIEEYNRETFTIHPENFLHAVKFRRSIRNYKDRPVEHDRLVRILNAGRYTPTAKNTQSCHFVVLQDRLNEFKSLLWKIVPELAEQVKKTAPHYSVLLKFLDRKMKKDPDEDPLFFNAPICLFIAANNSLDVGLAASNIETMAVAEGLGVLFSGYIQGITEAAPALKEWLGIAECSSVCCMLIGYPAVTYRRTAPRKKADIDWR